MKNVEIEYTDDEVIVRMKRDEDLGLSSTGKSRIVATTGGNVEVDGGLYLGLNLIKPLKKLRRNATAESEQ
jgi:hypothetical protein